MDMKKIYQNQYGFIDMCYDIRCVKRPKSDSSHPIYVFHNPAVLCFNGKWQLDHLEAEKNIKLIKILFLTKVILPHLPIFVYAFPQETWK